MFALPVSKFRVHVFNCFGLLNTNLFPPYIIKAATKLSAWNAFVFQKTLFALLFKIFGEFRK